MRNLNLKAVADLGELADYSCAFAVRAAAYIGIADHLAEPLKVEDLALKTGCNPHSLLRLMRALASKAVFSEVAPETFALTPISTVMRTDHPLSMRWFFRLEPDVRALAGLEQSVRTGTAAFDQIFGRDYFSWMHDEDALRERFGASQRALNRLELEGVLRSYPWKDVRSVVDVGGNDGSMVSALLTRNSAMTATVFDLSETARGANRTFAESGVKDRASVVAGNILQGGVPAGADVYMIKRVLVGFSDADGLRALGHIREAMKSDSRLLVLEPTADRSNRVGVSLDLLMLVLGLGRVRTVAEHSGLMMQAGIATQSVRDGGLVTIIEGIPARG